MLEKSATGWGKRGGSGCRRSLEEVIEKLGEAMEKGNGKEEALGALAAVLGQGGFAEKAEEEKRRRRHAPPRTLGSFITAAEERG